MHPEPKRPTRIAIDISVIIDYAFRPGKSIMLGKNYLHTPWIDGIQTTIAALLRHLGSENIFILICAGELLQERLWHWIRFRQLHQKCGLDPENTHFFSDTTTKANYIRTRHIQHVVERKKQAFAPWKGDHGRQLHIFQPNQKELERYNEINLPIRFYATIAGLEKVILSQDANNRDNQDISCQL